MWTGSFLLYLLGASLARLNDEGARVSLLFLAAMQTGDAGVGGLLVSAFLFPHVVAAPVVGRLIDRSALPLRLAAMLIGLVALTLATAAVLMGKVPLPVTLALLAVGGCGGPAITGALSSQLPDLVLKRENARAFGWDGLTYNFAGILGPAMAAILSGVLGPLLAAVAMSAAGGAGAVLIAAIRTASPRNTPAARSVGGGSPRGGFRRIFGNRTLAVSTVASVVAQVGLGAFAVVLVAAANAEGDAATAGWLMSAMALGAVLGSLLWTIVAKAMLRYVSLVLVAGYLLTGFLLCALAWLPSAGLEITSALFAAGAATALGFGATLTIRNEYAPDDGRAEIFALAAGAKVTAGAFGAAIAPALLHFPAPLIWAGAFPVAAGIGVLVCSKPGR